MGALGCENGWIQITDPVRPRVLLVAPTQDDLAFAMAMGRRLSPRARVEIATTDPDRLHPQVSSWGGVIVHRFIWRLGLACWLIPYADRYEAVFLRSSGSYRPESAALRSAPNVIRAPAEGLSSDDAALQVLMAGVESKAARLRKVAQV